MMKKDAFGRLNKLRPSPALVIACLALLVALGGTGYAVTGPAAPAGSKAARALGGYELVTATSSYDSSPSHSASAVCPGQKVVVGGGFRFDADSNPNTIQVQYARPFNFSNSYDVYGYEDSPYAGSWQVIAVAICMKPS
jgi:hypothetical protein